MDLFWFLLIGLIAGWLADRLVKDISFGLVGDTIVGIIGALIGGYLFRVFGIAGYGIIGNIVMATAGAVLLLVLLKIINRRAA